MSKIFLEVNPKNKTLTENSKQVLNLITRYTFKTLGLSAKPIQSSNDFVEVEPWTIKLSDKTSILAKFLSSDDSKTIDVSANVKDISADMLQYLDLTVTVTDNKTNASEKYDNVQLTPIQEIFVNADCERHHTDEIDNGPEFDGMTTFLDDTRFINPMDPSDYDAVELFDPPTTVDEVNYFLAKINTVVMASIYNILMKADGHQMLVPNTDMKAIAIDGPIPRIGFIFNPKTSTEVHDYDCLPLSLKVEVLQNICLPSEN